MQPYEKEHLDYILGNAAECTVLLKTNRKFPIDKAGKIAAYGSGLRYTVKGGTGSGEVNTRFTYTIEQGLTREGFEIVTKDWLDAYDGAYAAGKKQFYKDVKAEAKKIHVNYIMYAMGKPVPAPEYDIKLEKRGDTAIYVVSRISGEGSDRTPIKGDVKLTDSEVRDILALDKMYDRFMLVLNVGGVVDLSPVKDVSNILVLSQIGVDCGKVLSDILTGKQNPSGKLTTTWAAWDDYSKEGTFGDRNDTRYKEGIYVGYRYFDTFGKKPVFPFGYGVSYTTFAHSVSSVTNDKDKITVKVKVKNTGSRAGKEVIQTYVSLPYGKLDKAYQELAGFAKTKLLKAGEEEEVCVTFKLSDLASYDEEKACYVLEAGEYIVRAGNSSRDTVIAAIATLDETVVTLKARNCLGKPDFTDIKGANRATEEIPADAVRLEINAKHVASGEVIYDNEYDIDERVKKFTDEELAYFAVGAFNEKAALSVIGNAASHVAGAAGETACIRKEIGPIVMADGPAGLRLAKQYYRDEKGEAHDATGAGMIPESLLEMMGPVSRFFASLLTGSGKKKLPENAEIKEQMASQIPIGTAIAQSFNPALAESFGDIVGKEMEMFGVNLWLAPAMNIHRSILCGRNFEYFSEDPLVSGIMAAAITKGVQKHKGCGTVIKHYAANNAETNRYCNNSQVSERAMREIYLRGFGICVRESQPKSVMTSYNLLNGTHTSEHRGLTEDVLRSEFGFKGIVMTDWVIAMMNDRLSTYRVALSGETAMAGGDLFMPGCKKDFENVKKAFSEGRLTRKQLEINTTRVVRMADELTKA